MVTKYHFSFVIIFSLSNCDWQSTTEFCGLSVYLNAFFGFRVFMCLNFVKSPLLCFIDLIKEIQNHPNHKLRFGGLGEVPG